MLRQLCGKVSCCFCFELKISGLLFATFQSKDVSVEVFINELTPPVNGFFTLGCSPPVLWQEEQLAADERLERSLWDSLRAPRFAV